MKTIDEVYEQLKVALEKANYLISEDDYTWEESFYMIVEKMEDEVINATLDLKEVYVQEMFYDADFDYLPENFEDEIEFEVDDPELIEKLVDFVGNIDFCGVSDLVNDLLDEINELTEKYSVEAISFLSKELDSRGYFVG